MNRKVFSFKTVTQKLGKTVMIAITAMCIAGAANAQDKMKIAVMDFNPGVGVDASMVNGLSDMLINSLFETRKFTIVERTQLDKVITEQGFQKSSLSAGQIAQIGKILGVKSVLVGTVNFIATERTTEQVATGMITGEYNLDVRIIDVQSGEVMSTAGATKTASRTYRDLMPALAEDLSKKLFASDGGQVVKLLGYLSVFPEDLGNMTYDEATKMCKNVNSVNLYGYNDWRLPTLDEVKLIYQNRAKLDGLTSGYYLSSQYSYNVCTNCYNSVAGYLGYNFSCGSTYTSCNSSSYLGSTSGYIRLVRTDR